MFPVSGRSPVFLGLRGVTDVDHEEGSLPEKGPSRLDTQKSRVRPLVNRNYTFSGHRGPSKRYPEGPCVVRMDGTDT